MNRLTGISADELVPGCLTAKTCFPKARLLRRTGDEQGENGEWSRLHSKAVMPAAPINQNMAMRRAVECLGWRMRRTTPEGDGLLLIGKERTGDFTGAGTAILTGW